MDMPGEETLLMDNITIPCTDLDEALEFFTTPLGFRLEMISPADEPSLAVVSVHDVTIRLELHAVTADADADPADTIEPVVETRRDAGLHPIISLIDDAKWIMGRAGMEYRDLVPGRLNGRLIASHIRIAAAGEVPDYVHYHKVGFQMIYCWHGRVRVVYEGQGEPFWLRPGDCVLQPPEIRHRVLEAAADTQVIELTSPAVHETWADHDLILPTGDVDPDRTFGGQRFVHHRAVDSQIVYGEFGGFESHHMGIAAASNNAARVFELRTQKDHSEFAADDSVALNTFYFVLSGRVNMAVENFDEQRFTPGDAILIPPHRRYNLTASANSEILCVEL